MDNPVVKQIKFNLVYHVYDDKNKYVHDMKLLECLLSPSELTQFFNEVLIYSKNLLTSNLSYCIITS